MIHIPKGNIVTAAGEPITAWSGFLHFDIDKDRDEGYGVVDDVLKVIAALDKKGKGAALQYELAGSAMTKPIVIRDANLRGKKIWFHITENNG